MSRTIIAAPALLAALWCFSAPVNAQTQRDLAKECLTALSTGDGARANQILEEIKTWRYLFDAPLIDDALECLEGASKDKWAYSTENSRFISLEADRLAAERIRDEQRELLARKCALKDQISQFELIIGEAERLWGQLQDEIVLQRERVQAEAQVETVRVCNQWYEEDKRAAVTDLVCNKIFLTLGLPDTEVSLLVEPPQSGPTEDELNAARSGLASAASDLSIIERFGVLPEDYLPQRPSEVPEPDECAEFR